MQNNEAPYYTWYQDGSQTSHTKCADHKTTGLLKTGYVYAVNRMIHAHISVTLRSQNRTDNIYVK